MALEFSCPTSLTTRHTSLGGPCHLGQGRLAQVIVHLQLVSRPIGYRRLLQRLYCACRNNLRSTLTDTHRLEATLTDLMRLTSGTLVGQRYRTNYESEG